MTDDKQTCRLIRERGYGPGKGTPCGGDVVETLHGVRVCKRHSDEIRSANRMPPLEATP